MKRHRIRLKRVYEPAAAADGNRILVERLWPRGLSKRRARIDAWPKAIAPSPELRKWFDHRPERWDEFKNRYFTELDSHPEAVAQLIKGINSERRHQVLLGVTGSGKTFTMANVIG